MAKKTPAVPSSSLADIAFMLLIFFLVTTTMDTDAGLSRMLPPPVPKEQQSDDMKIKERNVYVVLINKYDQLLVEGEPMNIKDLKEKTKEFIANPADDPELPEKEDKEIPFFGVYPVSKQVISLQNDRGTSYGLYIQVQDELAAAYNELRNELALKKFSKPYDDLDKERQDAIRKIYPQSISEAEPKNYGDR
ncbi:MAG: biopolymer transporter ExbD [Salinivirgaceae bacterium]|nr:biopolymer transporter ExbD [Salinivirgaceae bacterium]